MEGAHDGGADEIVVYDMHESGRNIFTDRLPAYVRHIAGKPPVLTEEFRMGKSYDGLFMLGQPCDALHKGFRALPRLLAFRRHVYR